VPERGRWWDWNGGRYEAEQRLKRGWSETSVSNAIRCLRSWPARFTAAGLPKPTFASDVTAEMVLAWKQAPVGPGHYSRKRQPLKQTTAFQALWSLRGFLRWAGSPIAEQEPLWRSVRGDATNRRWFDQATVNRLWAGCASDRERLVVALTAWAGLRRIEIERLRVDDVALPVDDPRIVVSRKGGRRQELPIGKGAANALRPFAAGRPASERVFPASYNVIDRDLRRIGARIGIPRISCHDLRRTFGRMLYERGVDINRIRVLFGHRDAAMTYYYIGAESDNLRDAVRQLDLPSRPFSTPVPVGV
jgi:integrase